MSKDKQYITYRAKLQYLPDTVKQEEIPEGSEKKEGKKSVFANIEEEISSQLLYDSVPVPVFEEGTVREFYDWTQEVDWAAKILNWSNIVKFHQARNLLKGLAKDLYQEYAGATEQANSWETFCTAMVNYLGGVNVFLKQLENFQRISKSKQESALQFLRRFDNKCAYTNWLAKRTENEELTLTNFAMQLQKAIPRRWLALAPLNAINVSNLQQLKEFVVRAEQSISMIGEENFFTERRNDQYQNYKIKNEVKREKSPTKSKYNQQWCKYHKTSTHSTEECRAKKFHEGKHKEDKKQ